MSLPILETLRASTNAQLAAAIRWTADDLHVSPSVVGATAAVAYVIRHFQAGRLSGWEGFTEDTGTATGTPAPAPEKG